LFDIKHSSKQNKKKQKKTKKTKKKKKKKKRFNIFNRRVIVQPNGQIRERYLPTEYAMKYLLFVIPENKHRQNITFRHIDLNSRVLETLYKMIHRCINNATPWKQQILLVLNKITTDPAILNLLDITNIEFHNLLLNYVRLPNFVMNIERL
jgi:hypothetical protein